jgi:hypothetical protein
MLLIPFGCDGEPAPGATRLYVTNEMSGDLTIIDPDARRAPRIAGCRNRRRWRRGCRGTPADIDLGGDAGVDDRLDRLMGLAGRQRTAAAVAAGGRGGIAPNASRSAIATLR